MTRKHPLTVAAYDIAADGTATPVDEADPAAVPAAGHAYRWLSFDRTHPDFPAWVRRHVPDFAGAALVQSETRPRCETFDDCILLNLRGVNANPGADAEDMVALRMWVTPNLVVTARHRRIFVLQDIEAAALAGNAPPSTAEWLLALTGGLARRIEDTVDMLEDNTDDLEDRFLDPGNDDDEMAELAGLRSRILKLRRYLRPQSDALHRLVEVEAPHLGRADRNQFRNTANNAIRVIEQLDSLDHRLNALQDHLFNRIAVRLTRNGFVLSVVAAIFLPLGFLTGLFGMNVAGLPGTEWQGSFVVLTVAMAAIGVGLYFLFRKMRWF